MKKLWTIQRAAVTGIATGLAAVLAAAALPAWPDAVRLPYLALLAITAFCGLSVLWITLTDMRRRGRGGRMRPIRAFDLAVGLALLLPSGFALRQALPGLGL